MIKAKKDYIALEKKVCHIFQTAQFFPWNGENYRISSIGKPRPTSGGEGKTDLYVAGFSERRNETKEIKISIKTKKSYEWIESKVSSERARGLFGENWADIVSSTSSLLRDTFLSIPLLYKEKRGNTKRNSATMGWRLEITTKPRALSAPITLSKREINQYIYRGVNLPEEKQHGLVDGEKVMYSGVADYLLVCDMQEISTVEDVMEKLVYIEHMDPPPVYLAFVANNYRMKENKIDGARPLAVYVAWNVVGGKLTPSLHFDAPLIHKGKELIPEILSAFSRIEKSLPEELDETDVNLQCLYR